MRNEVNHKIRGSVFSGTQAAKPAKDTFKPHEGEKVHSVMKTINLSGDEVIVTDEIPGVYCQGVQYYDLKNIGFINYTGMANLVDFLKSLLEKGVEIKFVNVNENIKERIKSIGLEHILTCV